MRHLFKEFVNDIHKEQQEMTQMKDLDVHLSQEVKVPAIELFDELGRLFDKELKHRVTTTKASNKKKLEDQITGSLMVEDSQIGTMNRNMQLKVGAFLTNLMCKNLKYKIGTQSHLLL